MTTTFGKQRFSYSFVKQLPNIPQAVYVFWSTSVSKAVYVGKAENGLSNRLMQHLMDSHNPTLRMWIRENPDDLVVGYTPATTKHELSALERHKIRELDPIANVSFKP